MQQAYVFQKEKTEAFIVEKYAKRLQTNAANKALDLHLVKNSCYHEYECSFAKETEKQRPRDIAE